MTIHSVIWAGTLFDRVKQDGMAIYKYYKYQIITEQFMSTNGKTIKR